jgi:hypothetical protein
MCTVVPARPVRVLSVFALLFVFSAACSDDAGDRKGVPFGGPEDGTGGRGPGAGGRGGRPSPPDADPELPDGDVDGAEFMCADVPTAYVLETVDPFTNQPSTLGALLAAAGFAVQPLPLDVNPATLRGLIAFGSFASESAVYQDYVARNAVSLYQFVDKANILLQLTQADQTEPVPPFLPSNKTARRQDPDLNRLFVTSPHNPLIERIPTRPGGVLAWEFPQIGWEPFAYQGGFQVILAGSLGAQSPALLEGAYGQGRIVLSALALDKPVGVGPDRDAFNTAFFNNLRERVRRVCERRGGALLPTPSSQAPGFSDTSSMLVALPDTQIYSLLYPGVFTAQTSWIAANARKRQIAYVLHLGDIVDQNTPMEWERALTAMNQLDNVVPYALATGNHDYGPAGNARTRDTLLNDYFSYDKQAAMPSFGGAVEPGKLDNTYHLMSVGGRDYVVLALEWGPRDGVVNWADQVMQMYPNRYGILITHAYMNWNDRRYDIADATNPSNPQDFNPHFYGTAGGVNDGEELWQKLVRKHPFVMVFNGHVLNDGTGYLASVTDRGNICHQMLSNYQFRPRLGGDGYMRLVEFLDDNQTVRVFTYSPIDDSFLTEPDQTYTFRLDLPPGPGPQAP